MEKLKFYYKAVVQAVHLQLSL